MSPLDVGDCLESKTKRLSKSFGVDAVWNRYFRQSFRKNSITYYQKYGDKNNWGVPIKFKSTWALEDINKHSEEAMLPTYNGTIHYNQSTEIKYATANWTEFILDFVAQMEPKPTAFVFNQGLWPLEDFKEPEVYKSIISAISKAGMISIYKTTTKNVDSNDTALAPYERGICNLADHCLDLSWTAFIPKYLYADPGHFWEPVYSWMNIQMLDILFTAT